MLFIKVQNEWFSNLWIVRNGELLLLIGRPLKYNYQKGNHRLLKANVRVFVSNTPESNVDITSAIQSCGIIIFIYDLSAPT